ncbi:MAG: DUF885 family protein [Vicinamibacteria bacterium]
MPFALALAGLLAAGVPRTADAYLERYFQTFPTRATQAGRHDLDRALEDLSPGRRAAWLAFNRQTREALKAALAGPGLGADDRLDAETLLAQVEREIHEHDVLRRPERDPLYWSGLLSEATIFLLLREDVPLAERLDAAEARARALPALAGQAREALAGGEPSRQAPELFALAARQLRASAAFFQDGLAGAAPDAARAARLRTAGEPAAAALERLAAFLDERGLRAKGSPRLGLDYARSFVLGTGVETPVEKLLPMLEADLARLRSDAAAYGRGVFAELLPGETAPADERALLRRLFARVEDDHDTSLDDYFAGWRRNLDELLALVRAKDVVTLPEPLTLRIGRSPAYFVGQSVGGVYAAGPYAPAAETLLLLPMPSDAATPAQRETFFRAFNRHFNRMITPHELIPGHYLQLKYAARHPRTPRAIFADPVYVEGWGSFCERLLLDLGWGDSLPRLAHLKKQLENAARAIVDVRVHTRGMTRDEVLRFAKEDALQDDQFAANMWVRAITTAPQLTTYHLGFAQVNGLYQDVRARRGHAFRLREFMDGMMELGPVPVASYRERLLGEAPARRP